MADVKHGFTLWPKKYIVLLQRPPTPRTSPPEQERPPTPLRSGPHEQERPPTPLRSGPLEKQRPSIPPGSSPHEQQSPHLPERDPSVSPPSRDPPRKIVSFKRNGTPPRKRPRKEKPLPPIEKLPWEKTIEENMETCKSKLKAFFAKKLPQIPFKKTLDPVKVVRTIENLYDPLASPPSDYRRSIKRSYDEMMGAKKTTQSAGVTAKKGKQQVHQLGQQH